MNYGYQNEKDFVNLFNGKFLYELDDNSQKFIKELFGEIIDNNEPLLSWKNRYVQKADIFIKYKNYIKNISLKCGKNNSVHQEKIQSFQRYLESLNIPYKTIKKYISYHYGYKHDNDIIDFSTVLSSEEYKKHYQKDLDEFNNAINHTRIIIDMVDRFIVKGCNSKYDIDAFVCGTIDNYIWLMKFDIYDLVLSKRCIDFTSPHIACMTIGPKMRGLSRDTNIKQINSKERYMVCVRWNFIREDIINFKNNKK